MLAVVLVMEGAIEARRCLLKHTLFLSTGILFVFSTSLPIFGLTDSLL
jgi:hypothetical protein